MSQLYGDKGRKSLKDVLLLLPQLKAIVSLRTISPGSKSVRRLAYRSRFIYFYETIAVAGDRAWWS